MSEYLKLTDFRMAGFLVSREVAFVGTEINGRGEVVFIFGNATNPKAKDVVNLYPGSAEQKYDAACRTMHGLVKVAKQSAHSGRVGDEEKEKSAEEAQDEDSG